MQVDANELQHAQQDHRRLDLELAKVGEGRGGKQRSSCKHNYWLHSVTMGKQSRAAPALLSLLMAGSTMQLIFLYREASLLHLLTELTTLNPLNR